MNYNDTYQHICDLLSQSQHDADRFTSALREQHLVHLSFSQVSTLEFCPYRYYLQYILHQDPQPIPTYFTKGKLFHELLADSYQQQQDGHVLDESAASERIRTQFDEPDYAHLLNAFMVHQQHHWLDLEVKAVEQPFVMQLAPDLPPMVGVIDLILEDGNQFTLVDHKTGSSFYPYDELQVAIYAQYIHSQYGGSTCRLVYDHYRWVNNLERIRKPAFRRTQVSVPRSAWSAYLTRIRAAQQQIETLQQGALARQNGQCYRCPYKRTCRG